MYFIAKLQRNSNINRMQVESPEYISIMGKYTIEDCPGCSLPLLRNCVIPALANERLPGWSLTTATTRYQASSHNVDRLEWFEMLYCYVNVLQSEAGLSLWQILLSILTSCEALNNVYMVLEAMFDTILDFHFFSLFLCDFSVSLLCMSKKSSPTLKTLQLGGR